MYLKLLGEILAIIIIKIVIIKYIAWEITEENQFRDQEVVYY